MSAQSQRRLVERWFIGLVPSTWEEARAWLLSKLKSLERILSVLHQAVEYPPPSVEAIIACSADTAVTSAVADTNITGCTYTFTPDVDMKVVVNAMFDVQCTLFGAAARVFTGRLIVNGTVQTQMLPVSPAVLNERSPVSGPWVISCAAGTQYTFDLAGRTNNADTTYNVRTPHTRMVVTKFPNIFRVP